MKTDMKAYNTVVKVIPMCRSHVQHAMLELTSLLLVPMQHARSAHKYKTLL